VIYGASLTAVLAASTHPQLPGFLHSIQPLLNHYGYLAVALIVLIESFGPPLPGEPIIIAASIYAGAGTLNIWGVFAVAYSAAVVGDNIGYAIGHFGGTRLVVKYGKYIGATEARYGKAEKFFVRYGGRIVIIARFIEGLRQLNGIIAGTTQMPWRRFFVCNAFGAALWVALWTIAGDQAGSHIDAVYNVGKYVAEAVIVALVIGIPVYVIRRRRRSDGPPDAPEAPEHEGAAAGR
jgi:membrane protein DedA with SNARE-associated domain